MSDSTTGSERKIKPMCFLNKERPCPDVTYEKTIEHCVAFDPQCGSCSIVNHYRLTGRKASFPVSAPPPEVKTR